MRRRSRGGASAGVCVARREELIWWDVSTVVPSGISMEVRAVEMGPVREEIMERVML
jgi:hypothetical protein